MGSRPCTKCGQTKLFSEFGPHKRSSSKLNYECKGCVKERTSLHRATLSSDTLRERMRRSYSVAKNVTSNTDYIYSADRFLEVKVCTQCKQSLAKLDFHKSSRVKDGFYSKCKFCVAANRKEYYEKNTDRCKEYVRKSVEASREKTNKRKLDYYYFNKDYLKLKAKMWRDANPHVVSAVCNKRRLSKKNAIPSWANLEEIKLIYKKALELSEITGIKHSVDHIVPIQGETVCGFHVEYNLRVIPLIENISKGNKLIEDLFV